MCAKARKACVCVRWLSSSAVSACASGLLQLGLARGERVAIYLEKRFETVVASFGAPAAGGVFVPLNPLLKPEQVGFILRDCEVRVLVTSPERLAQLGEVLAQCPSVRHVVLTSGSGAAPVPVHDWAALLGWLWWMPRTSTTHVDLPWPRLLLRPSCRCARRETTAVAAHLPRVWI